MPRIFTVIETFVILLLLPISYSRQSPCTNQQCRLNDDSLRFFLLGDWGGFFWPPYVSYGQMKVAQSVGRQAQRWKTHFQLSLGDNFYLTGVNDEFDWRFRTTFEEVYTAESLHTPWYVLLGNHDHFGNSTGQIAYSRHSKRCDSYQIYSAAEIHWPDGDVSCRVMPSLYYPIRYRLSDGTSVLILMLDTIILCGNSRDLEFADSDLDWLVSSRLDLGEPDDPQAAETQWEWLEQQLKDAKLDPDYSISFRSGGIPRIFREDYVFVAGHYPMLSTGDHGAVQCMRDRLLPLMAKYQVQAYFCGHDHNLQHIHLKDPAHPDYTGHQVVSGAAGFVNDARDNVQHIPKGWLQFDYPRPEECDGWLCNPFKVNLLKAAGFTRGGYVYLTSRSNHSDVVFYRGDGEKLYQFQIKPRPKELL